MSLNSSTYIAHVDILIVGYRGCDIVTESVILARVAAVIVNNHTNEESFEICSLYNSLLALYHTLHAAYGGEQ